MTIVSSRILDLEKRFQETDDLETKAAIFESVKIDTENFTSYPKDCIEAIKIINTYGLQAKLHSEARSNLLDSKKERDQKLIPSPSSKPEENENTLTNKTLRFLSNNSGQIITAVSSVAFGILGALYLGAPYPVRIGSLTGTIAFAGIKLVLEKNRSIPSDIDHDKKSIEKKGKKEIVSPKSLDVSKAKTTTSTSIHQSTHLSDSKNPNCLAISIAALSSLLLNPDDRKITDWMFTGNKLYEEKIKNLELKKERSLSIEEIKEENLLPTEIILDPKILKPNNDLNILKCEEDLTKLINELMDLSNNKPIGAIISLAPDTYPIFYNPKKQQFFFINSNLQSDKPAYGEIFRAPKFLVQHLLELKPIDQESLKHFEKYETETKMNQNPNACEIRILRKKEYFLKEDEITSEKKLEKETKTSTIKKQELSREEKLQQSEKKALKHALTLSSNTSPSNAENDTKEDFSSSSSSSNIIIPKNDSLSEDELLAISLQFE